MTLYEEIGEKNIDLLVDILYDDIIANDDRINFLFHNGFEKVKVEQKKFFRVFLGAPANVLKMPNLKEAHMKFPISPSIANYWVEDFDKAIEKIEMDSSKKYFLKQKIKMLGMHIVNTTDKNKKSED